MASYNELFRLVANPGFRERIQYALWSTSVDVLNDAQSGAQAKNFARKMLRGQADNDVLMALAIRCAANPAIAAAGEAATDPDIKFVVAGSFADLVS
ncbi:MAG: hypothetical protein ACRCV5_20300 [Afipia sp.]